MPGQNWPRAIESAIETSDFFIACFSGDSVSKKGGFQAEIRYALDCARQVPLDEIFLVPVRLDPCAVPRTIEKQYQYVDLFPIGIAAPAGWCRRCGGNSPPRRTWSRRVFDLSAGRGHVLLPYGYNRIKVPSKTFYIETFGCQMNVHDSEKVIGTLMAQGYPQVDTPEDAGLVLYNTCSIRDKAEQKVFNRLQNFKREAGKGKDLRRPRLRGPAGRRKDLRQARRTSAWSPGRPATRAWAKCWSNWKPATARHGAEPGYRRDFRHSLHAPRQSAPGLHHDHRGLRQILRVLRGPLHPRTGAQPDQRKRHGGSARGWPKPGFTRNPAAGTERQQLSRSFPGRLGFRHAAGARGRDSRHPPRALHHFAPARFCEGDRRRHGCQSGRCAITCICRCSPDRHSARRDGPAVHAGRVHAPHRLDEEREAQLSRSPPTSLSAFPARRRQDFQADARSARRGASTIRCSLSNTRRGRILPRSPWTTTFRKKRRRAAW